MEKNDRRPYTYFRIQRILKAYGFRAENIWQGYKACRRYKYCEHYRIVRLSDNQVVVKDIRLDSLRWLFTIYGFPLEDGKSIPKKNKEMASHV